MNKAWLYSTVLAAILVVRPFRVLGNIDAQWDSLDRFNRLAATN